LIKLFLSIGERGESEHQSSLCQKAGWIATPKSSLHQKVIFQRTKHQTKEVTLSTN
jgi:hypothetical protein